MSLCLYFSGSLHTQDLNYSHPTNFTPETYLCYTAIDTIIIDGKADEQSWKQTQWTKSFIDIEGNKKPLPYLDTRVKMLWDEQYFYFYAKMEEPHVWASLTNRDDIMFRDDDIEIFIDPDGDTHNYYELEFNAFNSLWDLILLRPYRVDKNPKVLNNWNIPNIKSAVHIEGTINDPSDIDKYWSIEVAIPWSALSEFAPKSSKPSHNNQWRINYSRVDWDMEVKDGNYVKSKDKETNKTKSEHNWVWSAQGFIAMHMPEMWGYVKFKQEEASIAAPSKYKLTQDHQIRSQLWNIYWAMIDYYNEHHKYTEDVTILTTNLTQFDPDHIAIFSTPNYFEIVHNGDHSDFDWIIRSDGKIWKQKSKIKQN